MLNNRHRLSCLCSLSLFSLSHIRIYRKRYTPPSLDCGRKMLPPIHPSTIPPSCYRLSRFPSCRRRQTGRTLNFTRRVFPILVCIGYTADTDIVNHSPKLYYCSPFHSFYFLDPPCTRRTCIVLRFVVFFPFPFPSSSSHLFSFSLSPPSYLPLYPPSPLSVWLQIKECIDEYANIFLFSVQNMRNTKLKDVRSKWRDSRFFFGRNKVMIRT